MLYAHFSEPLYEANNDTAATRKCANPHPAKPHGAMLRICVNELEVNR
jgi:hypothetical protein